MSIFSSFKLRDRSSCVRDGSFQWTEAYFGYPGRACFFFTQAVPLLRELTFITPNPTRLPGGSWVSNSGSAEMNVGLEPSIWV
jgi:hypothetical protein